MDRTYLASLAERFHAISAAAIDDLSRLLVDVFEQLVDLRVLVANRFNIVLLLLEVLVFFVEYLLFDQLVFLVCRVLSVCAVKKDRLTVLNVDGTFGDIFLGYVDGVVDQFVLSGVVSVEVNRFVDAATVVAVGS